MYRYSFLLLFIMNIKQEELIKHYIELELYNKAITEIKRGIFFNLIDISAAKFYYGKILYSQKQYKNALYLFYEVSQNKEHRLSKRALYYYVKSLIKLGEVRRLYELSSYNQDIFTKKGRKILLSMQNKKLSLKSPYKALLFSMFIPGLGIYYAGDTSLFLKTFFTNALLISLSAYFFHKNEYISGIICGYFAISFYTYNLINTVKKVKKYNEKIKEKSLKALENEIVLFSDR